MNELDYIMEIKYFLEKNSIEYNTGRAFIDDARVEYYVGKNCLEDCLTHVVFNIKYDRESNVKFIQLDSNRLHTEFSIAFQNFLFDRKNNTLVIKSRDPNNKHGDNYKIIISFN